MSQGHVGFNGVGEGRKRKETQRMSVMSAIAAVVDARMEEVKQELLAVFSQQLDVMLQDIAETYSLELGELQERYQVVVGTPVLPKKASKPRKKASSDSDGERVKCEARTAKGAPCKNFALTGGVFCACHNKAPGAKKKAESSVEKMKRTAKKQKTVEIPSDDEVETTPPPKKRVPEKAPGAPKKAVVKHNHRMDEEEHDDCSVCQTLGNAASRVESNEEPVVEVSSEMQEVLDTLFDDEDEWSGTDDDGEDDE